MKRLEGRVCVITGGASGIGEAMVRLFAAEGARLVVADVQDHRGRSLVDSLDPDSAVFVHADVSVEADVRGAITLAQERFGRLDVLCNNAGIAGPGGPIDGFDADAWDATMAVLLRGVFLGIKHAARPMKRQGSGSIVNTASVAGLQAGFGSHLYSAAKAAVIQLTRSVAMELGEAGVRVNCICPGGVATPIFGKAFGLSPEDADRTVATVNTVLATTQPLRRAGRPDDIAEAALWLAGDASGFVNGHALVVDGGLVGGRLWSDAQQRRTQLRALLEVVAPQ